VKEAMLLYRTPGPFMTADVVAAVMLTIMTNVTAMEKES